MVTISVELVMTDGKPAELWHVRCDSTDVIPEPVPNGSDKLHIDTGEVFCYSGSAKSWVKQ